MRWKLVCCIVTVNTVQKLRKFSPKSRVVLTDSLLYFILGEVHNLTRAESEKLMFGLIFTRASIHANGCASAHGRIDPVSQNTLL